MIDRKIFMAMILVPLLIFGIYPRTQVSVIGDVTGAILPKRNLSFGLNINSVSSWERRDPTSWSVAARGEVTEDCLLYGICADGDDDDSETEDNS